MNLYIVSRNLVVLCTVIHFCVAFETACKYTEITLCIDNRTICSDSLPTSLKSPGGLYSFYKDNSI